MQKFPASSAPTSPRNATSTVARLALSPREALPELVLAAPLYRKEGLGQREPRRSVARRALCDSSGFASSGLPHCAHDSDAESSSGLREPANSLEDEDVATGERLLMLISSSSDATEDAEEVLRSAAACYSARVLQHATGHGDSESLVALPPKCRAALTAYLSRPDVAAHRRGMRMDSHASALVDLVLSRPADLAPAAGGASASQQGVHVDACAPAASADVDALRLHLDSSDESDPESDLETPAAGRAEDMVCSLRKGGGSAHDDNDEDSHSEEEDLQASDGGEGCELGNGRHRLLHRRPPSWARPGHAARCLIARGVPPSPVLTSLLAREELGWPAEDEPATAQFPVTASRGQAPSESHDHASGQAPSDSHIHMVVDKAPQAGLSPIPPGLHEGPLPQPVALASACADRSTYQLAPFMTTGHAMAHASPPGRPATTGKVACNTSQRDAATVPPWLQR